MAAIRRNNVHIRGSGERAMVFAHGFGCDQNMWRLLAPVYAKRYRTVLFDLVGSGKSDLSAFDKDKYASLHGYADDVLEIVHEFGEGPALFVGHSVSAMIGMLAGLRAPEKFAAHVMVGPSPCYIDDDGYVGGFTKDVNPQSRSESSSSVVGKSGSSTVVFLATYRLRCSGSKWSRCRCETKR